MPHIIVERSFDTPLTQEELNAVEARMAPCLDLYNVRWIRSYLVRRPAAHDLRI